MALTLQNVLGDETLVPPDIAGTIVTGLTADSRKVRPGFVFFAIAGSTLDGAKFLKAAFEGGAIAAVVGSGVKAEQAPLITVVDPRLALAQAAARFFPKQPETLVAVTGTNGKTSVVSFTREIWQSLGLKAASIGTIGIVSSSGTWPLNHTTPDPVELHRALDTLTGAGVTHAALEASSHGLAQLRLDGLRLQAAAFTNLTRDHLDYHGGYEAYFQAKMRLFEALLPKGASAVIDTSGDYAERVADIAKKRGLRVFTVGAGGTGLNLLGAERSGLGQKVHVRGPKRDHHILLPLVGAFQLSNALVAAGLVIATGGDEDNTIQALESLKGAKGRLELVGTTSGSAPVFVDYAHTPDALINACQALHPYVKGRLAIVLGAGGDRDPGKRPLMGKAAAEHADIVIVTDDNPRTENPAIIRRAVMTGAPDAVEIGDRAQAIAEGVALLREGDVLLVAGKGHEPGQTIGTTVHPFSDHDAVKAALQGVVYHA